MRKGRTRKAEYVGCETWLTSAEPASATIVGATASTSTAGAARCIAAGSCAGTVVSGRALAPQHPPVALTASSHSAWRQHVHGVRASSGPASGSASNASRTEMDATFLIRYINRIQ